jgi:predicted O-linked N-acetylglucosamine transferase (SPINDLY family)
VALDPSFAPAHEGIADVLALMGRASEAVAEYRHATLLAPERADTYRRLAFALNYHTSATRAEIYAAHLAYAALQQKAHQSTSIHDNDPDPRRRLRVGYVSGSLRDHADAYFVEPLVAAHDHARVEVFCYSLLPKSAEDVVTWRLRGYMDHWRRVGHLSAPALARRITRDRMDVLVDLGGYTAGGSMGVFAMKPAPVQVTWLGYLNTTGLSSMDYRITDPVVDPAGEGDRYYSERLVRIRAPFLCYRPPEVAPPPADPPFQSAGHVTFGCFNDLGKLSPEVLGVWGRLLEAVPGSRLIVKTQAMRDPPTVADLEGRLAAAGIARERLDLLAWRVHTQHHLARYGLVDIALDPFPFAGVTTTCEALWMGVPVVTLLGGTHAGRVGATLLGTVGLDDLVTRTPDAYIQAATSLARDPKRLTFLRRTLRGRMQASRLCAATDFAGELERAYRRLWRRWCRGRSRNPGRS